jgi:phenol 2-monooxygenase
MFETARPLDTRHRRSLMSYKETGPERAMQFHLNGFTPGDPDLADAAPADTAVPGRTLPETADVLIIGCGPAGLTLAAQLAAFPDIRTVIVDQKSGRLRVGQADGIACRTMEMFEAFGFSEHVLKEAYWVNETSFWKPDDRRRETIIRHGRIRDTEDGLSEFPHVILNQARVHDFYLDTMRRRPARLEPDYARRLRQLEIDRTKSDHAVTATFDRLDPTHDGQSETIRASYVVGCDGAHSAVRKSLGLALRGDSASQAWGVMDILAVTDFPDIRLKAVIQSATEGSVLIIPREGGYMVRLYIELDKLNEHERVATRNIDADHLISAARRILHPYTLEVKEIAWWSVYDVGQRLCDRFDDVPAAAPDMVPSVFIAGDACHTHSPKAGQGMNVSMQDGFNLGWKLASVIRGQCAPAILHTYTQERQAIAAELIDFDHKFHKMFSAAPKNPSRPDENAVDPVEFQKYFMQQGRFTAGTATRYQTSIITGEPAHQHLAEGFTIGTRFHSAPVICLADAKPWQLGHTIKADGSWRLFIFAPAEDPASPTSHLWQLCAFLQHDPASPIRKYTPAGADIDAVIDVRAVLQQSHRNVNLQSLPALLRPAKGRYGLYDYEKTFCPDMTGGRNIFDLRQIDRNHGCIVIVRPDQYIAHILKLDAHAELSRFFDGFFLP